MKQQSSENEIRNDSMMKECLAEMERLKKESQDCYIKIEALEAKIQSLNIEKEQLSIAFEQARQRADEVSASLVDLNSSLDRTRHQLKAAKYSILN
jgi:uncharacterized coiled-coil DUF342 family protein